MVWLGALSFASFQRWALWLVGAATVIRATHIHDGRGRTLLRCCVAQTRHLPEHVAQTIEIRVLWGTRVLRRVIQLALLFRARKPTEPAALSN